MKRLHENIQNDRIRNWKGKEIIKTWEFTNPNKERYLFAETKDGTIITLAFLGYRGTNRKLIKR